MLKCCGEKLSSSDSDEEYICVNVNIHDVSQLFSKRGPYSVGIGMLSTKAGGPNAVLSLTWQYSWMK